MSEQQIQQQKKIIIVAAEKASSEKLAEFVQFLDCESYQASDMGKLSGLLEKHTDALAIFVIDKQDLSLINQVFDTMGKVRRGLPCYLIQPKAEYAALPSAISNKITGALTPNPSYHELLAVIHEAELLKNFNADGDAAVKPNLFRSLVGTSKAMESVRELVRQVAPTEATVLILGESGTGKEVVARDVHLLSQRRKESFVPVNCGAIPAELLESELFGHEKGAFTGAITARQGRFEIAEGGTLFLDEIGDMPMNMQVKLLRVLQERSFERVGSNKSITMDVRVLAATHQNLEQLVAEGKFRMDLYYRLAVFPIDVPPLRERAEDIPLLVREFINRLELKRQGSVRLSNEAVAALGTYGWPGNVRELANLIERLTILFPKKQVKWSDLPDKLRPNHDWVTELSGKENSKTNGTQFDLNWVLPDEGIDLKNHLMELEQSLLLQALEQSDWVVARAAKLLSMQRTTLVEKMKKLKIARPEEASGF